MYALAVWHDFDICGSELIFPKALHVFVSYIIYQFTFIEKYRSVPREFIIPSYMLLSYPFERTPGPHNCRGSFFWINNKITSKLIFG
jgi:hypothetical protein